MLHRLDYNTLLLRLTDQERQKLQLVVAALKVSEYTDDVDDMRRRHMRDTQMARSAVELFDTITGLAVASHVVPHKVKEALRKGNTSIGCLEPLLEDLFEIARRHKRLNPHEHRGEYGKLVMLLQDVQRHNVRRELGLTSTLVVPLRTVGRALTKCGLPMLSAEQQHSIRKQFVEASGAAKAEGLRALVKEIAGEDAEAEPVVERCLRSIDDVCHFLEQNYSALRKLRKIVEKEFSHFDAAHKYNIAISRGSGGACLSHSHRDHCLYVRESLLLWEIVQRRILDIWEAAESDMLVDGGGRYDMVDTGQGFHRMCSAPKSYTVMSNCVAKAEQEMGGWIGIKVIHLGDRDVPNPLVFIDKYTVIPRIVQPVIQTVESLQRIFEVEGSDGDGEGAATHISYPGLKGLLISKFGSFEQLRMMILTDFFKHAFDGSGDDGGSCIDGRITSAWNWCHQLVKKPYYDAFVLTGFNGFD